MEEAKKKIRSFRLIATSIKTTELLVAGCLSLVTRNQRPATRNQQPNHTTNNDKLNQQPNPTTIDQKPNQQPNP